MWVFLAFALFMTLSVLWLLYLPLPAQSLTRRERWKARLTLLLFIVIFPLICYGFVTF
jgi:nitrate reductase NapE component